MILYLFFVAYICSAEIINVIHAHVSKTLQPSVGVHFSRLDIEPTAGNAGVHWGFNFCVQTNRISLPKTLLSLISADSKTLKPMVVFYQLKNLYKGGTINRIRGRYNEIADVLGISESKLRKDLKWLYKENLAHVGQGGELRLVSNKQACKQLGVKESRKKHTIPFKSNKTVELHIKAFSINESLEQQKYIRDKKLLNRYVSSSTLRSEMKASVINWCYNQEIKRAKSIEEVVKPSINLQITLSRKGIARRFGCVSSSTGSRLIKKLKKEKLIKSDRKKLTKLFDCTYPEMLAYKYELNVPNMVYRDGAAWLRSSNTVRLRATKSSVQ